MSKKASFKKGDVDKPPQGQNWCWLSRDLIESPAWRARSVHCARLIDFLMHEHLSHGGDENGHLVAPYAQLAAWGIGRRYIKDAITEAEALKLVAARHGGKRAHTKAAMTRFRLTFYHSKESGEAEPDYYAAAGDEWRKITAADARQVFERRAPRNQRKNAGPHGGTGFGHTVEPLPVTPGNHSPPGNPQKPVATALAEVVTPCALLSISREGEGQIDAPAPAWVRALAARPTGQYASLVARLSSSPTKATATAAAKKLARARLSKKAPERVSATVAEGLANGSATVSNRSRPTARSPRAVH